MKLGIKLSVSDWPGDGREKWQQGEEKVVIGILETGEGREWRLAGCGVPSPVLCGHVTADLRLNRNLGTSQIRAL